MWRNRKHSTVTTGTLPNGDDTYQIVTLVVLDEEEGQYLYCRVEHDSLTEPLMIQLGEHLSIILFLCQFVVFYFSSIVKKKIFG